MVFLNCSSCYSFFSGCEEDDNGGFRAKRRRISSCDHAYHHEKQGLPQFSGIPNRFCTLRPTETGSYRLPNIQQRSNFCIVPVLSSIRHLANTRRKRLETRNPDSPMNADLKPLRKQVCKPDSNPHYTRRVNAITHINIGFNAD